MFRSLVLAGGGCRCFWQAGFLEVVLPVLVVRPASVGAVSAGAAMACMVFAAATRPGLEGDSPAPAFTAPGTEGPAGRGAGRP